MKHKKLTDLTKEVLDDDIEMQLAYLKASFEDNYDMPEAIMAAIREVAEVRGIRLSGNTYPRIDTFFKILNALGMRLTVEKSAS